MDYLDKLNPAQKEAVTTTDGPLLIIAGAGAGKTRVITYRILHLIKTGIDPKRILAITFTNKAAREMRERVETLLKNEKERPRERLGFGELEKPDGNRNSLPFLSTFHALGVYILRQNAAQLGLSKYFTILDRDESLTRVKTAIKAADLDPKRFEPRKILGAISRQKGAGLTLERYKEEAPNDFFPKIVIAVWERYEKSKKEDGALDFDDLLLLAVQLLKKEPETLTYYQELWTHIHIDEYQDTNAIQYELTMLLARKYRNLCVVGDMDQSIYGWRGADFTNILNFEKDFPETKVVTLEENYRSTQTILTAANAVIAKNKRRREKKLFTKNKGGAKISIFSGLDEGEEAKFIAQKTKELIDGGSKPEEIAVLYRANFQSRVLEEAFLRQNIPYQVLGVRFFDRKEIKDVIAYIKFATNPSDFESLKRIINVPPRGIGKATLAKIAAKQIESLPVKTQEKVGNFFRLVGRIKSKLAELKPSEFLKEVIKITGIEENLKTSDEEDLERLENIRELVSLATKYDEMPAEEGIMMLLTEVALATDQDQLEETKKGVKLMTVHAAKGLEFDYVFISGLEQDLFPHTGFGRGEEERDDEEERRLFYVAITRAREKLFLTYSQVRTIFGSRQINMPSEFIFDIDEELLEAESNLGVIL